MGKEGLNELQKAVEIAPAKAIPHLFLGMHWLGKKELSKAIQELEISARLDQGNPTIAAQLGEAYAAIGDYGTALQAYQIAASLAPEEPTFWLLLSQFCLKNEFQVESTALPAARKALVLAPDSPAALDAMGYSYFLLGELDFAEHFLRQAATLAPDYAVSHYHLGLLWNTRGQAVKARIAFETAQSLDPDGSVGKLAQRALEGTKP
jgi:Flp pilus assembly protein TadD